MSTPYNSFPASSFWKSAVAEGFSERLTGLYSNKFWVAPTDRLAFAGSCFAQHLIPYLREHKFNVMDVEPAPPIMPMQIRREYEFGVYSARYSHIYTARHLLQLAQDAFTGHVQIDDIWERGGRFYDAMRMSAEPKGFESLEEAVACRRNHLEKVGQLFATMQVFFFTVSQTEAWGFKSTGRIYPVVPGTAAGEYNPEQHVFVNFSHDEVRKDIADFYNLIRQFNPHVRLILSVSPVPASATASGDHILLATVRSKAMLCSAVRSVAEAADTIDYFPAFDLISSPWSKAAFYEDDLRRVSKSGMDSVARLFIAAHRTEHGAMANLNSETAYAGSNPDDVVDSESVICDELLLDAFSPKA